MDHKEKALKVHQKLLEAFGEPLWRNPLPPVDELVSTILSQNTNDVNRDRAFDSLRKKFPTFCAGLRWLFIKYHKKTLYFIK